MTMTINAYWFALTARSQVLTPLIVPLLVQRFVGEALKGTYVGRIRLWTLMVALLMQALMGLLSDRSTSRWGRRRPFILGGALGEVIAFVLIGAIAGLEGLTGYWVFFGVVILSMIASNATCGHPGDSFRTWCRWTNGVATPVSRRCSSCPYRWSSLRSLSAIWLLQATSGALSSQHSVPFLSVLL